MLGRGGGKCPLTQESQGPTAQETSDPCRQGEFAWMWFSVPCWLHVSLTSWVICLCSVPLGLSLLVSLSLQVCLFLPLTMSVYLCIDSGSLFSLHCPSPCLSWFRLPSRSLSVSVSPSLSLSPLCLLSAQCPLCASVPFRAGCFSFHPSASQPASLSPLRVPRSGSRPVHLCPQPGSLFRAGLCLRVSLRPRPPREPAPPRAPADRHSAAGPDPARGAPLFAAPSSCAPPPPHRPPGPAFPSSFPAQASWAISPAHDVQKCAAAPGAQGTGRLRLDHPDDTMGGWGGAMKETPHHHRLLRPVPPYGKAGKG